MRSSQEFIHWLEAGVGARWLRRAAVAAGIVALSLLLVWKQFHGPATEATLEQANVGRQIAAGQGFTTLVNYPQTVAVLKSRGRHFDPASPLPELHQAPLYSLVIGGVLRLIPARWRRELFAVPAQMSDGFGADYVLLAINLGLFWIAGGLSYQLGRRLFEPRVGWVAAFAVLTSVAFWTDTLRVNGTPLLMVLALVAFLVWERIERGAPAMTVAQGEARPRGTAAWLAVLGGVCGLLFLTEYSAGTLVLVALGYAGLRFRGRRRWLMLASVGFGFAVVSAPWIARNMALTGNPVALAAGNIALKAGDATAEPAVARATFSARPPAIDLRKVGNKTLTVLQQDLRSRLWSGGAMWLAAFFVAGWLYAFRSPVANRLRWVFTAALAVLMTAQAALNSGESDRLAVTWLAPLIIVFGAGFFFVLLGSNATLGRWPRAVAAVLLLAQALPLVHDAMAPPPAIRFQYPPYFPALLRGMRSELAQRHALGRFGAMADIPAGLAWYGDMRAWAQPAHLRDFYTITLEQPIGELLLTPRTLDRPFFSDLNARPIAPGALSVVRNRFGRWGEIYAGLVTGTLPRAFPLRVPHKVADNLYVLLNPALPPVGGP